jgi:hypothetical protein
MLSRHCAAEHLVAADLVRSEPLAADDDVADQWAPSRLLCLIRRAIRRSTARVFVVEG